MGHGCCSVPVVNPMHKRRQSDSCGRVTTSACRYADGLARMRPSGGDAITVTDADAVWFTGPVWAWFLRASGEPGR